MSIVYRQELGRELTWSEADNNFAELKAGVDSKKSNFDVLPVTQGGTGQETVDAVKVAFDIATKTDLASSAAGKGAELVEYQGATVEAALNERLPEIGTYALLRAYTGPVTAFLVRGVANIFDGGFGVFRVDAGDTTTDDNGGTVLVDAAGRRWKRKHDGRALINWFGAVADGSGTSGTENTAAIQSALNCGLKHVTGNPGAYLTDTISIPTGVTFDLSPGITLLFAAHTTSHNPMVRMGDSTAGVSNAKLLGGKLVGNSASQTYVAEEWSPGVMIWGSNDCKVLGTIITDCKGDGVTLGYDAGRVVGSNRNTIYDCEIYACARQQIAITYGNENNILYNRISGNIDLELNASTGECKNNLVHGNKGRIATESLTAPRISDLAISLASLNTDSRRYSGNTVSENHCFLISGQYNSGTGIHNNLIVGSNESQNYLLDLAAFNNSNVSGNRIIANSAVATALSYILRTRAGRYLNVTGNTVENEALDFHGYIAGFGAETATAHNFRDNQLTGTGAYRTNQAERVSEYALFQLSMTGGTLTLTQLGGVPVPVGSVVRSANNIVFSNFGKTGAGYRINILPQGSATAANATTLDAQIHASIVSSGSSRTATLYQATVTSGAVSLTQIAASTASATILFEVWY